MTLTEPASHWLRLRQPEVAERFADTFVMRHNLTPPIDVDLCVRIVADVEEVDWPFECDALIVGLGVVSRPTVFLRKVSEQGRQRQRFTMAHELGHVVIPWHLGRIACSDPGTDEPTPTVVASGRQGARVNVNQEAEATLFASALMLPFSFIESRASTMPFSDLMNSISQADLSAPATLRALKRHLLPGFLFTYEVGGATYTFSSSGTDYPARGSQSLISWRRKLQSVSHERGSVVFGNRPVNWYRLSQPHNFDMIDDPRTTTEILRAAIGLVTQDVRDATRLLQSINGKASGSLSVERTRDRAQALSILKHKFDQSGLAEVLLKSEDFNLYLHRKVDERVRKLEHGG